MYVHSIIYHRECLCDMKISSVLMKQFVQARQNTLQSIASRNFLLTKQLWWLTIAQFHHVGSPLACCSLQQTCICMYTVECSISIPFCATYIQSIDLKLESCDEHRLLFRLSPWFYIFVMKYKCSKINYLSSSTHNFGVHICLRIKFCVPFCREFCALQLFSLLVLIA
jgi:hypothetical protein